MAAKNIGLVVGARGVTHALSLLNSGVGASVDPRIDTLVVFSETQQGHFTLTRGDFGAWDPGTSFLGNVSAIKARVLLTAEGESTPRTGPGGTAGGADADGIPTGRPLTPNEALVAYKKKYPKAKGMSDEAILEYIAAIVTMYNEKKSAGHLKVGKISTIQEACERSGLMGTNKQGKPAPFYQRGGRKNYRSRALEAIFHWVTGLSPKKKNTHGSSSSGSSRGGSSSANNASSASGSAASTTSSSTSGRGRSARGGSADSSNDPTAAAAAAAAAATKASSAPRCQTCSSNSTAHVTTVCRPRRFALAVAMMPSCHENFFGASMLGTRTATGLFK